MPAQPRSLTLPAARDAVRAARRWVGEEFSAIGRDDLVDSAHLSISELVTNAIVHVGAEVVVRVTAGAAGPRVEVCDSSAVPPSPKGAALGEGMPLATYGRGLELVAAHSAAWGSHPNPDGNGKVVWFEPVPHPHDADAIVDLFDIEALMSAADQPAARVVVELVQVPVQELLEVEQHTEELRRELDLIAEGGWSKHPAVREFTSLCREIENGRWLAAATAALCEAAGRGDEEIDLRFEVPTQAPDTIHCVHQLVRELEDGIIGDQLLLTRSSTALRTLSEWRATEFLRQAGGDSPRPWSEVPQRHRSSCS